MAQNHFRPDCVHCNTANIKYLSMSQSADHERIVEKNTFLVSKFFFKSSRLVVGV